MEITVNNNNVKITGNIKSVSDYQNIKTAIDLVILSHKMITINISDSLTVTSSVIGYLNKLVLKENIDLSINIANEQLYKLFDDLNLIAVFKVKKC